MQVDREQIRIALILFGRWAKMKQRSKDRGHEVPVEWAKYPEGTLNFIEWALANGFSEELVLDRKDGTKGYSPDNCRFVTWSENSYNRVYSGKYACR